MVWEIKEEKTTVIVHITSFQGRVLEYDGGGSGGELIGDATGRLLKKARATWGACWKRVA